MTRLPNGLKKVGAWWKNPTDRQRTTRRAPVAPVLTPAQIEARHAENSAEIASFIERQTADFDAYVLSVHPKVADRDARIAVEGDTDLNHDNVEEPADSLAARVRRGETVL